jgi:choline-sulfatase
MLFDLESDPTESVNLVAGIPVPSASKNTVPAHLNPTGLPTPGATPGTTPAAQANAKSFFPNGAFAPTPPRTPSPTRSTVALPPANDPATLLAHFIDEVRSRWDLERIHQEALVSQRRRRLVYSALIKGNITFWDWEPRVDPSKQYVRNQGKGVLDDVEIIARWPRLLKQATGV